MKLFQEDISAPKAYFRGTHRSVAPAETLRRFVPRLGEMGITRLADITGLDCVGLPVYVAVRPASRNLSTSQGKGFDHDSAKASAIMESIESWHAERTAHVRGRVRGRSRTHCARVGLITDRQFREGIPLHARASAEGDRMELPKFGCLLLDERPSPRAILR